MNKFGLLVFSGGAACALLGLHVDAFLPTSYPSFVKSRPLYTSAGPGLAWPSLYSSILVFSNTMSTRLRAFTLQRLLAEDWEGENPLCGQSHRVR
jgi:hypothetical protein